jgi:entericidin A
MKFLKQLFVLSAILVSLTTLTACNTMEGAGKDTQKAGEKLENAADRNK